MPLCPQITNTPITVTQTGDFTVSSVVPAVADTKDGLTQNIVDIETTADGKNKIFRQTSAPTATAIGDLWIDTDDGNKLYYWTGTAWVSVQDNAIATAQATADSKIKTFYQASAPTATGVGDIWFDTDDGFKQYFWNGTAWTSVQDTSIAAAQSAATAASAAATAAQTTADGKNRVFRQSTTPTASSIGDIWFNTGSDNAISRWDGSSWVATSLGNNALANLSANKITSGSIDASVITVSNLNAGNISTGTLSADRIAAASITGAKIAAATITASNIATGTITASQIAASTITGSLIAAATITASNIAANTITASQIASGTITATQIAAGTITTDKLVAGTLTGFTVQTSSGNDAVILNGSSNAIQIKANGSVVTNMLNFSTSGALWHYGSTPTSGGTAYPLVKLTSTSASIEGGSSAYFAANAAGNSVVGATTYSGGTHTFSNTLTASSTFNANSDVYMPNLTTTTSAANMRVGTGTAGEVFESTASSQRFKENIVNLETVFDLDPKKLLDLPVRAFSYKDFYLPTTDDRSGAMIPGFIAEEVDTIYPIAADYDGDGPRSWNERFIIPGLLALIQDLYKEIALLKGE